MNNSSFNYSAPTISIPEVVPFIQTARHDTGWSDHYGALYVAASYCDLDLPDINFPHIWQHGCIGPWITNPALRFYNSPSARQRKIFVAREEEVRILNDHGYSQVYAVGLPVVYLPELQIERIPNSLLLMPQHTLVGIEVGSVDVRRAYVESLKPYADRFETVLACVSPNCLRNGYYAEDFERLGIEVISGALTSDVNAYLRMKCIMQQFETMTTNSWGSNVAYALYYGMKVSIFGDPWEVKESDLLRDTTFLSLSEIDRSKQLHEDMIEANKFFSDFINDPLLAKADPALGSWLVGDCNRKDPKKLRELFDWN